MDIWARNREWARQFNAEGGHTWRVGMTRWADLTNDEYRAMLSPRNVDPATVHYAPGAVTPIDWRTLGAVCPIKDQGQCGSCWAFSAIDAIEGCNYVDTKQLLCLSEQQLVDCAGIKYGNMGCGGGMPAGGYKYVIDATGCELGTAYPYTAKRGDCVADKSQFVVGITAYTSLPSGNETALQEAVLLRPISVGIDASLASFQLYTSGVYCPTGCSSTSLDHGVGVVGMNTDPVKGDYYIVRNSWGTSWGMQGYLEMCANHNNNCGIATSATYTTGCHKP
eukprot:TRINITY_DN389_c0_g1_i10.p1 TRINITY_DN389_c0_g1~~TRINITY_DN389_c0_g1_i10.p1  ORF type:complete len:279 (-),score=65.04 TRINITY_DN389_c0_g1_i10:121-957(-)